VDDQLSSECDKMSANRVRFVSGIFQKHDEFIRRHIRYKTRKNAHIADDIYQNVFVRMTEASFGGEILNIKNYLAQTINTEFLMYYRKRKRYENFVVKYADKSKFAVEGSEIEGKLSSDIYTTDDIEEIFAIMERVLYPSEAKAIKLRYMDDCNSKQILEEMGVKAQTLSGYLSVGLKKLRQFLDDKGPC